MWELALAAGQPTRAQAPLWRNLAARVPVAAAAVATRRGPNEARSNKAPQWVGAKREAKEVEVVVTVLTRLAACQQQAHEQWRPGSLWAGR